jgi:hypothetical protein
MAATMSDVGAFLDGLHARGVTASFRGRALKFMPYDLGDADRAFVREHREAIKAALRDGYAPKEAEPSPAPAPQPPTTPAPEPEPVVFAHGIRITDALVRASLLNLGDQALADYVSGRTSKVTAYDMTRCALAQSLELRGFR